MEVFNKPEQHDDYLTWLASHQDGYVLNTYAPPRGRYLVLHRAACGTINGTPTRGRFWTKGYTKVCATDTVELDAWAQAQTGAAPHPGRCCHR